MKKIKLEKQAIYPSKIICVGRNYAEHIEELKNETPTEPVIFIKPNSAISNNLCIHIKDEIHYEGEIVFLVQAGKLHAVGFGLDLTKREIQAQLKTKGLPWERAKAFDASAVFSEFIIYDGKIEDLRMELYINDKLVQQAGYDLMLNKPQYLLDEIKTFLSLEDGDLIMTGTPKGVGKVNPGDVFSGKIFEKDKLLAIAEWIAK